MNPPRRSRTNVNKRATLQQPIRCDCGRIILAAPVVAEAAVEGAPAVILVPAMLVEAAVDADADDDGASAAVEQGEGVAAEHSDQAEAAKGSGEDILRALIGKCG